MSHSFARLAAQRQAAHPEEDETAVALAVATKTHDPLVVAEAREWFDERHRERVAKSRPAPHVDSVPEAALRKIARDSFADDLLAACEANPALYARYLAAQRARSMRQPPSDAA